MKYRIKAFALFALLSFSLQLFSQTGCVITPDAFNNLHVTQGQAHQIIPDGGMTIIAPGSYHVLQNITGQVIVDADDVFIEMNGFTLIGEAGKDSVITINAEKKNIVIQNGHIIGNDQTHPGILAKESARALVLKDLHISNCDNGIHFVGLEGEEIKCCHVLDCFITGCKRGAVLEHMTMSVFEHCDTCCCTYTSFELINCKYNKFKKCKAVRTGNSEPDKMAMGYSAVGGFDNLFYECMAEGINKTGTSDWCTKVIGFNFGFNENNIPEQESKIVSCLVDSVKAVDWATAFGIRLDMILKDQVTELGSGEVVTIGINQNNDELTLESYLHSELDWSPQCDLIAFGEFWIPGELGAYKFVRFDGVDLKDVITKHTRAIPPAPAVATDIFPFRVQFSPDGQFLLVNGRPDNAADPDLNIYEVKTGALIDTIFSVPGAPATTLSPDAAWFNCGNKIALSANTGGNGALGEFYVYLFDGKELTLSRLYSSAGGNNGGPLSISPDDKFLAINWAGSNDLNIVNIQTGVFTFVADGGIYSRFNPAVCCDKYYVAVIDSSNNLLLHGFQTNPTFSINPNLATLTFGDISDAQWHPTGKYLAIARSSGVVYVYRFDPNAATILERIDELTHITRVGTGVINIAWSPCGNFLAILGGKHPATQTDFEVIEVGDSVKNCLVDSNKVANCTGGICSFGIFGCSCCNGIMRNVAYESCINFSPSVHDVWCKGAVAVNQLHFNVSIPPY